MTPEASKRTYHSADVVQFRKTREHFGGLSNMCAGFPLVVNGVRIRTSEAIYQACRFPSRPDIQRLIIDQSSPMTAKMKSKPYRHLTRSDWDASRIVVMRWVLRLKLAQNFERFGRILEESYPKPIVEDSRKDAFWGAIPLRNDDNTLIGVNALGRLLMELRQKYMSSDRYDLLLVKSLDIAEFKLFGHDIADIDERPEFLKSLSTRWRLDTHLTGRSSATDSRKNINKTLHHSVGSKAAGNDATLKTAEGQTNNSPTDIKDDVLQLITSKGPLTSKQVTKYLQIEWSSSAMTAYLKTLAEVSTIRGKPLKFAVSKNSNGKAELLFD